MELAEAVATIAAVVHAISPAPEGGDPEAGAIPKVGEAGLLDALRLLRWVQAELAEFEPALIVAARQAGASWQTLAPALGVASRQAAERRYLRMAPSASGRQVGTQDDRVRAVRDRRAGKRAVARWANVNTADLRRLAGQITALADLGEEAEAELDRLHRALADPDATALPVLLTHIRPYLQGYPDLAHQIDAVTANTEEVRRQTQEGRDNPTP